MLNPDLLNEVTRRLPQLAPSAFWSPKNKKSLKAFINNSYSHEGALFDSKDVFHDTKIKEALQITSCDPLPCRILANVLASVANDMRPRLSTVTDIAPIAVLGLLSAIYTVPGSGAAVARLAASQLQFLKRHHEMIPLGPGTCTWAPFRMCFAVWSSLVGSQLHDQQMLPIDRRVIRENSPTGSQPTPRVAQAATQAQGSQNEVVSNRPPTVHTPHPNIEGRQNLAHRRGGAVEQVPVPPSPVHQAQEQEPPSWLGLQVVAVPGSVVAARLERARRHA